MKSPWRDRFRRMGEATHAVYPRGEAPRWVTLWQRLDPGRSSPEGDAWLWRLALICAVPIMLCHGIVSLVYGHSALLTPFGFIDMPGACAWLAALCSIALAVALTDWLRTGDRPPPSPQPRTIITTHTIWQAPGRPLRQVELKTALPPEPVRRPSHVRLRGVCLVVAAIAFLSACVGRLLMAVGLNAFARPVIAFAPRAEWPLEPIRFAWPWVIQLARNDVVLALIGIGVALFFLCQFLAWRKVWRAWLPLGVIGPLLVAAAHLGSAAYDFAAARGLGGFHDADLLAALASDPGRHNFYTFLSLCVAGGCASVGLLVGYLLARSVSSAD